MASLINMIRTIALLIFLGVMGSGLYMTLLMDETIKVSEGSGEPGIAMKLAGYGLSLLVDQRTNRVTTALTDAEGLSRDRAVLIVDHVPLADMLAAGEAMPSPVFQDLFAEGRVGAFVQARECGAILETIGTACVVVQSHARRDASGDYEVRATLAFAAADPTGALPEGRTFDPRGHRVDLFDGTIRGLTPAEAHDLRAPAYRKAAEACAAVRQSGGPCAVRQISFEIGDDRRTPGRLTVDANATMATLAPVP